MLTIDVSNIPKGMKVFDYMILFCKANNIVIPEDDLSETLRKLQTDNYIKITNYETNAFDLRTKADELGLKQKVNIKSNVSNWIDEYRRLFKVMKGTPGSMGDRKDCIVKMEIFMKENPQYDKDKIIDATNYYLQTIDNPKYIKQADYFIKKHGQSGLSQFCEEVENSEESDTETFHEQI